MLFIRYLIQHVPSGYTTTHANTPTPPSVTLENVRSYLVQQHGPFIEVTWSRVEGVDHPVNTGWSFKVPDTIDVDGDREEWELLALPMWQDPDTGRQLSPYMYSAEQGRDFRAMADEGLVDRVVAVPLVHEEW